MADGIATVGWVIVKWMMLLPQGRWYSHGSMILFNFSSEMLSRTSSHMCGRLYLPIFLFRDGLLTLMYRASFCGSHDVLVLPSHNIEVFNTYAVTSDVVVVKYGAGGLLMFLEPLSKCSRGLSYIFLLTLHPTTFVAVDF